MNGFKNTLFSKPILIIIATVLVSSFLLYIPFLLNLFSFFGFQDVQTSMLTIYQNYDGVLYVVPAKTMYDPQAIEALRLEQNMPIEYYAAHLPLYPVLISAFVPLLGYLQSMIAVNLLSTVALAILFYVFVTTFKITSRPLLLTVVMLFLPRFFILRSVGSPESLFLFCILSSVFFFEQKKYLLSGILGACAVMTKVPGILLFVAYGLVFLEKMIKEKIFRLNWLYITLIPVGLVAVFALYKLQYGDFFAYFHTDGVVPMPYPFSVFNSQAKWVDTAWLEEIILYLALYLYTVITLKESRYRSFFYFSFIFLTASIFVQHRDLSRYMLPIWPFAVIALQQTFTSKRFLITLILLLPAIYLYAANFMLYNILPVADWRPFL